MFKFKRIKNKVIVCISIISLIIFISSSFILIKKLNDSKKTINSNNILKTSKINPINTFDVEKIIKSQYKESNNWRIKIEKIHLDAPILEGTTNEVLRRGVGHFESSSKENGNICLAAHNRGYKYNYFQEIKKLENGDIITYMSESGNKNYKVFRNEVIEETDWTYLKNTEENIITLVTCEENAREYRRCIQAKEVKI